LILVAPDPRTGSHEQSRTAPRHGFHAKHREQRQTVRHMNGEIDDRDNNSGTCRRQPRCQPPASVRPGDVARRKRAPSVNNAPQLCPLVLVTPASAWHSGGERRRGRTATAQRLRAIVFAPAPGRSSVSRIAWLRGHRSQFVQGTTGVSTAVARTNDALGVAIVDPSSFDFSIAVS